MLKIKTAIFAAKNISKSDHGCLFRYRASVPIDRYQVISLAWCVNNLPKAVSKSETALCQNCDLRILSPVPSHYNIIPRLQGSCLKTFSHQWDDSYF